MKRENKFRGLSSETPRDPRLIDRGGWVFGSLFHDTRDNTFHIWDEEAMYWVRVDPATVGKSTGLHDKNGREIYEGDIFKTTDSNGECRVAVEWDSENARILGRDQRKRIWYVAREPLAEIIGNIHENPELLN